MSIRLMFITAIVAISAFSPAYGNEARIAAEFDQISTFVGKMVNTAKACGYRDASWRLRQTYLTALAQRGIVGTTFASMLTEIVDASPAVDCPSGRADRREFEALLQQVTSEVTGTVRAVR